MNFVKVQALRDLLRRYCAIFIATWAMRRQFDTQPRLSHELAFLPANLELIEAPVHPAPQWAMRSIIALALITLLIALFGQLDIVVSAKGKLLPDARVKIVQPALTGVVRRILIRDGERVAAGQLLMELDTTQAAADADKAHEAKLDTGLTMARSRALLEAQSASRIPLVAHMDGASIGQQQQAQRFADGQYREYRDRVSSAQSELLKREAELESTRHEIAKLQATAPLARQQANDYRALASGTYVAKHEYLSKEQSALEQENELEAQRSHANQLRAGIQQQGSEIATISSQFRREQLDTLTKASQQFSQDRNDETKAQTRQKLLSLSAPVAGTVQQLVAHTLGGVVTAAQAVMVIVPDDAVEVEASIENKDIGFVIVGQDAIIKIEAFPYTRFGYLTGKIVSVSNDAVQDKKLGLTFVAHIRLTSNRIRIKDKWINLTPGMAVTAEINTGKRSVAHYFFDPLVQTAQESMRER